MSQTVVRPWRCSCSKIRYQTEQDARAAAERHPEVYGTGFHPRALKSRGRILAYHMSARRIVDVNWVIEHELHLTPNTPAWRTAHRLVDDYVAWGLVRPVERPGTRTVQVADEDGLFRVIQIGWEQYRADMNLLSS